MKWKIVPVEPDRSMLNCANAFAEGGATAYAAAIAAAPPYVVTDEDVHAASCAYLNASGAVSIRHAVMRAALEAFLKRLGGES